METARRAIPADRDRIVELATMALDEFAPLRGGAMWLQRESRPDPLEPSIDADLADPEAAVFVGSFEDVVVGYAVVRIEPLRSGGRLGVITDLFVEPAARGVSVGEAMMDRVIEWCVGHGCVGIDSQVLPGHRAAKNFFERFGLTARAIVVHRSLAGDEPGGSLP